MNKFKSIKKPTISDGQVNLKNKTNFPSTMTHVPSVCRQTHLLNFFANIASMPNVLEAGSRKVIAAPVADSPISEESKYFATSVVGDILYVLELY